MITPAESIPIESRLAERQAPDLPFVMYQRWDELLLLHWAVNSEVVARHLPPGLTVDTFDGQAWIGVVPFNMRRVRPRYLPVVPGLSDFPELNLRTYVVDQHGRPGVWFYSLDTPKRLPNWIARTFFHLNYRLARIEVESIGESRRYRSELRTDNGWDFTQEYGWNRVGRPFHATPGSLEFFLVERYRLFAYDRKRSRLLTGVVHHEPYPVQSVELAQFSTRLFKSNGLDSPVHTPTSALASSGVDVAIYPMKVVG